MKLIILLILPIIFLLSACGGGSNYLAISGTRCPKDFKVEVFDENEIDNIVAFDINQLPVGEYEYMESVIYYTEADETSNPTKISVSEKLFKTKDSKTKQPVDKYNESINCARNLRQGQNLAFSYTLTTGFSIAESQNSIKDVSRSAQVSTRVANVLMSQNTKGALKPSYTTASNKETSDKLSKFIPAETELQLYKKKNSVYELRTKTKTSDSEVISVVKYKYKAPGQ